MNDIQKHHAGKLLAEAKELGEMVSDYAQGSPIPPLSAAALALLDRGPFTSTLDIGEIVFQGGEAALLELLNHVRATHGRA